MTHAAHRLELEPIRPTPPFRFSATLARLATFARSAGTRSVRGEWGARQAVDVDGSALVVELADAGTIDDPLLTVTVTAPVEFDTRGSDAVRRRITYWLGLDDDLAPFYAIASADVAFAPVLDALYGYHLVRHVTPFEAAAWAIVRQRTPHAFAEATMRALAAALGSTVHRGRDAYTAFPAAERLLGARAAVLDATRSVRKADRLMAAAGAFASAPEDFLRTAPWDEVAAWLRTIHGIGPWSIDYVMLHGLGRTERAPWTDTGMLPAISRVYTQGFAISKGSARELAERYGRYRGYWVHYLKRYTQGA